MSDDFTKIALFGATGVLGREILVALEGETLEDVTLIPVAGSQTSGQEIPWPGGALTAVAAEDVDPGEVDIAIFATPGAVSDDLVPELRDRGALVIDCSGADHGSSTTLAPGYDPAALEDLESHVAIANPAAAALAPLVRAMANVASLESLTATVLVGASMSGREGQEALGAQTVALLSHRLPDPGPLGGVLAFNLLPGGPAWTVDADPGADATRRHLRALVPAASDLPIRIQLVQAPVFSGVAIAATLATVDGGVDRPAVLERIDQEETLLRSPDGRPALRDALDLDGALLGSLHWDEDDTLKCWVVSDALQRTAMTVGDVVGRVVREDLW